MTSIALLATLKSDLPAQAYPKILQGIKLNKEAEQRFKQIATRKDPDQYILDTVVPALSPDMKREWEKAQYAYEMCTLELNKERHKKDPTLLQKMVIHFCEQFSVEDIQRIISSKLIKQDDVEILIAIFFNEKATIDKSCQDFFKELLKVHRFTNLGTQIFMRLVKEEGGFFSNAFKEQAIESPDFNSEPLSFEKDGPRSEPCSPSPAHLEKKEEQEQEQEVIVITGRFSTERPPQNPPSVHKQGKLGEFRKKVPNLVIIQIRP